MCDVNHSYVSVGQDQLKARASFICDTLHKFTCDTLHLHAVCHMSMIHVTHISNTCTHTHTHTHTQTHTHAHTHTLIHFLSLSLTHTPTHTTQICAACNSTPRGATRRIGQGTAALRRSPAVVWRESGRRFRVRVLRAVRALRH